MNGSGKFIPIIGRRVRVSDIFIPAQPLISCCDIGHSDFCNIGIKIKIIETSESCKDYMRCDTCKVTGIVAGT